MQYETNAPEGAALLDQECPGWAARIDLATLGIKKERRIRILEQLYGDYDAGLRALFAGTSLRSYKLGYEYGFDVLALRGKPDLEQFRQLCAEWTALIGDRLS